MKFKTKERLLFTIGAILLVLMAFLIAKTRAETTRQAPQGDVSGAIPLHATH